MCILYLSKVVMYKVYYYYLKNKYGNNLRLFFTDTDRLLHEIKTEGAYEDFSNDKKCLILVIICSIENAAMIQTNYLFVK